MPAKKTPKKRKPAPARVRRANASKGGAARADMSVTQAKRAATKECVTRLRLAGWPVRACARKASEELGYSVSVGYTCELLHEAMAEAGSVTCERGERLRNEQLEILDEAQGRCVRLLLADGLRIVDEKPDGAVMEMAEFEKVQKLTMAVVKTSERIAKLAGLDAPEKVEQVGGGISEAELVAIVKGGMR